jgi:A/G-specific adenine glycosylase
MNNVSHAAKTVDEGPGDEAPSARSSAADPQSASIAEAMLAWYDVHRRRLPWRAPPGSLADPYVVWLSEIMLQQTTVKAVQPYFERFLTRWPTVTDLANAPLDDVLSAWAGLGYYARARNLHRAAIAVRDEHGERFPDTEEGLRELPGIGAYTGAAIAAIAFGRKASPLDGNIERVMARLHEVHDPLPGSKPILKAHAEAATPEARAGDFAQSLMDLGATICTPKSPACVICPLNAMCAANVAGVAVDLPRKAPRKPKPDRVGAAFCIMRADGAVLLRKRPPKGSAGRHGRAAGHRMAGER